LARKGPYTHWELEWVQNLLLKKIGQLSDSVKSMQHRNFQIEDNVLDRLQLLRGFNDELRRASSASATQVEQL
jgi:hypothetical protein